MKKLPSLRNCPLFLGIAEVDVDALLACLKGRVKRWSKGESVIMEGDAPSDVGIVLSGGVQIIKDDYFGNRNIISEVHEGDTFGEALVCAQASATPVSVVASSDSELLLIDYSRIIKTCSSACSFHMSLIGNMLRIIAQKNISLMDKLEHLTRRSTREKVLSYLSEQAKRHSSSSFEISFNRQELADYLSVERSALSAELSKLRNEGTIEFRKNSFVLL